MKFMRLAVLSAALAVTGTTAQAQLLVPSTCSSSNLGISSSYFVGCFNWGGNTNDAGLLAVLNGTAPYSSGMPWTFSTAQKSDSPGNGIFTGNPEMTSGTLTFDTPQSGWFGIGLKASNEVAVYVYNATAPVTSFTFSTAGVGNGRADLSHAAFYDGTGGMSVVPEPSTYALMAAGLSGLLAVTRRRRSA